MICIRPMAPFGEMARTSPKLSACITARIHAAGMPKRCEASATKAANRVRAAAITTGRAVAGSARTVVAAERHHNRKAEDGERGVAQCVLSG